jgi:hypothetical protein
VDLLRNLVGVDVPAKELTIIAVMGKTSIRKPQSPILAAVFAKKLIDLKEGRRTSTKINLRHFCASDGPQCSSPRSTELGPTCDIGLFRTAFSLSAGAPARSADVLPIKTGNKRKVSSSGPAQHIFCAAHCALGNRRHRLGSELAANSQ